MILDELAHLNESRRIDLGRTRREREKELPKVAEDGL